MLSISENIKQKALELGFHKVGFAKVERLVEEGQRLGIWLKNGHQGNMTWMEKNIKKRIDPREIFHEAKSVISVALNYFQPIDNLFENAKISRYAIKGDYHEVIGVRLHRLLDYIKQLEPSAQGVLDVDSGPIMEKAWAVRAGIGWQGKHSITITKEFGSWVFLGEIITNIALDYDSPHADLCGDCTLCIEACPSGALSEYYVLNANRCIAYLTIEHKDEISEELKYKIDNWIFGCDICQEVCPWNQKYAKLTNIEEFIPRKYDRSFNLISLMKMTEDQFNTMFKNNPIKRTGYNRFRKNVQTVLENQQHF
ncbi:MAG: tRNA epoxyqueuosine(34) reductase QueG [Bacteroidota bacterium]|nr:tRNA epoxyqueuosine(34) reductase QueG [Bacteroidota bacterium]